MNLDKLKAELLQLAQTQPDSFLSLMGEVLKEVPAFWTQVSPNSEANVLTQVSSDRREIEFTPSDKDLEEVKSRLSAFRKILTEDAALLNRLAQ